MTLARYRFKGLIKIVEGWGKLSPVLGKFENLKFVFFANFGLLLVETMNPCVGFFAQIARTPARLGLRKLERNRVVRIREKFG